MTKQLRAILEPVASLKITVALFAMAMFLIFAGTLAQVELGNWTVVDEYFRTTIAWIDPRYFNPMPGELAYKENPFLLPFPGGYIIGGAMLLNLLAAHVLRFQVRARGTQLAMGLAGIALSVVMLVAAHYNAVGEILNLADQAGGRQANLPSIILFFNVGLLGLVLLAFATYMLFGKRDGIVLLHAGVIILLVGEAVTGLFALETQMPILVGDTIRWSHDIRESELVVVDPDHPAADRDEEHVIGFSQDTLRRAARYNEPIADARLPFEIYVERYMINTHLQPVDAAHPPSSTHGMGAQMHMASVPEVSGTDREQQPDMPGAIIRVQRGDETLGQYALSAWRITRDFVEVNGKRYELQIRFRRYYKPYAITLLEFEHDRFVGTNVPRNFASQIRLVDESQGEDRNVRIHMNHPLRYKGETFYQASFSQNEAGEDVGTVLSVVQNPGAWMPYYSCVIVGLGMTVHFLRMLFRFAGRAV